MFKNLPLLIQQMIYFSFITLILVAVGVVGLLGMRSVSDRMRATTHTSPLIMAAMEMKMAVASDLQYFKGLEAAQWPDDVEAAWTAHEAIAKRFTTLGRTIIDGGETEAGTIPAATDERLRKAVADALTYYEQSFHAKFTLLADLVTKKISAEPYDYALLDQLGAEASDIGETIIVRLKDVETSVLASIDTVNREAHTAIVRADMSLMVGIAAGVLLALLLGVISSRNVTRPIRQVVALAREMAEGDFTRHLTIGRRDEIGQLVDALNQLVTKMEHMLRQVVNSVDTLRFSSTEMTRISGQMIEEAAMTADRATTVADATEEISGNMNSISAASEQATTNVSMVAEAIEETTRTVQEIAGHSQTARRIADAAVGQADQATAKMNALGNAATAINKVTEVITEISEQTNLLALNATIEAARAGDAGKGFAVVANEIKALARQTAEATGEIKAKIDKIQQSTDETVGEMQQISDVIRQVNTIVDSIASAMDGQLQSAETVAENVKEASQGFAEINHNMSVCSTRTGQISCEIGEVKGSANALTRTGDDVSTNVRELSQLAERLHDVVDHFQVSPPRFDIATLKKAHLAWAGRLNQVLAGRSHMSADEMVDHRDCDLGKWYYGVAGQAVADLPGFDETGQHHETVHRLAREILQLTEKGETAAADRLMAEFHDARIALFDNLDTLYCA